MCPILSVSLLSLTSSLYSLSIPRPSLSMSPHAFSLSTLSLCPSFSVFLCFPASHLLHLLQCRRVSSSPGSGCAFSQPSLPQVGYDSVEFVGYFALCMHRNIHFKNVLRFLLFRFLILVCVCEAGRGPQRYVWATVVHALPIASSLFVDPLEATDTVRCTRNQAERAYGFSSCFPWCPDRPIAIFSPITDNSFAFCLPTRTSSRWLTLITLGTASSFLLYFYDVTRTPLCPITMYSRMHSLLLLLLTRLGIFLASPRTHLSRDLSTKHQQSFLLSLSLSFCLALSVSLSCALSLCLIVAVYKQLALLRLQTGASPSIKTFAKAVEVSLLQVSRNIDSIADQVCVSVARQTERVGAGVCVCACM